MSTKARVSVVGFLWYSSRPDLFGLLWFLQQPANPIIVFPEWLLTIDDYAKDGGPGVVRLLCSFYHEPLRSLIVKEV